MRLPLRDYQKKAVDKIRSLEDQGKFGICLQLPTGGGKTLCMAELLLDGTRQLVLTHRKVLLEQLAKVLRSQNIPFGFRAAGYASNLTERIQLAMINTEHSRAHKGDKWPLHDCVRVHVDEIHAQTGRMAETVINAYHMQGATLVGYTATPREIGHLCSELVVAATVPELIEQGYLMKPVVFGPDMPDAEKLEKAGRQANGEYSRDGLKKIWKPTRIFGRVLDHYRLYNPGCPAVLFAPGVAESQWFAQQFTAAGVRSAHVDADNVWLDGEFYKSDSDAREQVFREVEDGNIKILCNRFVLREGWDCPIIGHAILATPYGAFTPLMQSVGRVLRPYPGRTHAIIQDHGGNWLRHPPVDAELQWELDVPERVLASERIEKIRTKKEPEPINCPECHCVRASGDTCPECGHRTIKRSRPVLQASGQLKMVQGAAYKEWKVRPKPDDAEVWKRLYFGNLKNRPHRTMQQIYCGYAATNNWRWLPRDLPLMPATDRGWFLPVGDVPQSELIP